MPADGGDCEAVLAQFATTGIDVMPWRQSSRTMALNRSSIPGTSSWR